LFVVSAHLHPDRTSSNGNEELPVRAQESSWLLRLLQTSDKCNCFSSLSQHIDTCKHRASQYGAFCTLALHWLQLHGARSGNIQAPKTYTRTLHTHTHIHTAYSIQHYSGRHSMGHTPHFVCCLLPVCFSPSRRSVGDLRQHER